MVPLRSCIRGVIVGRDWCQLAGPCQHAGSGREDTAGDRIAPYVRGWIGRTPLAVLLIPSLGTAGHAVAQSPGPLPTVGEIVRDGDDCDSGVPGFHVRVSDLPDVDPSAGNGSLEYWFIATYDGGQTPRFQAAPSTQSRRSRRTPATSAFRSPCQAPPPEGPAGGSRPSSSRRASRAADGVDRAIPARPPSCRRVVSRATPSCRRSSPS